MIESPEANKMTARPVVPAVDREVVIERRHVHLACAIFLSLWSATAAAQSFDCRQARDAVERTICGSQRLRELHTELGRTYDAALKRDPARVDAIRQAQQFWAKGRSTCTSGARPSGAAPPEQCLAAAYTERLAALAAPAAPLTTMTAQPAMPPSATTAALSPPVASGSVAVRTTPPVASTAPQSPAPTSLPATGASAAVAPVQTFAAPSLATGLPATPFATATLERGRFPTAGKTDVLLHVTTPGRFAIRAESPTGTALQLVDMLTGPGDRTGWPGKQDGRIDALLDTGTYKVRAFGDPSAMGDTVLSVAPFTEASPAQIAPGYQPVAMTLGDLGFQSFWLAVDDSAATTRIEAAGRGLAALTLWRDGRDLVEMPETVGTITPTPAHPLTDIVMSGQVPKGTYLVTAYGGPQLPWADGGADEPFYFRSGHSTDLLAGGASGQVGVFGTEVFAIPPDAARALLILPQPADVQLDAAAAGAGTTSADLAKNDRAAVTTLGLPEKSARERFVSLRAAAGQPFTLRALATGGLPAGSTGRYWFGVAEPWNGGDEAPAAAILTRVRRDAAIGGVAVPEVLAAPGVPAIGPDKAWRTRFNLRGETRLLFQATDPVTVAVRADGPPVEARIATIDGAIMNVRGDGRDATEWSLSSGWYALVLTAKPDAIGILDLTLGPPGLIPPTPEPSGLLAPILPLGEHEIDARFRFDLVANHAPGGSADLISRTVPIELADGPLVLTLAAGALADIAVHARTAGILVARDISGGAPLETRAIDGDAATSMTLPASDHARTVAVALLRRARASPEPAPAPDLTSLSDGQPAFLDLDRDEQASFALTVGQGGLFRVETTGRLKTSGSIGTAFIPVLGEVSANGVGNNMLLQHYLRAGRYRLDIAAQDSAGRLGVSASATPLDEGAQLRPGGSARATLSPGHSEAFPIRIETAGRYRLDLLGDGRTFSARLEDSDGWPLNFAGDLTSIEQDFPPGEYRLIVQPASVQARAVARLRRIEQPVALTGHGPHSLKFDAPQSLEWREPPSRDDPRVPDVWTFALAGPAKVTLSIDGDGMAASLQAETADAGAAPLGRLLAGGNLVIDLPAGSYRVAANSLGRNDRLTYTISLRGEELQPDTPRDVTLPVELPFAIAEARVVTLTSFGRVPLRAELRADAGSVLARVVGRTDDWNIALSRFLPAGRYRLALARLLPPAGRATFDASDTRGGAVNDDSDANENGESTDTPSSDNENQAMDQPAEDRADQDQGENGGSSSDKAPPRTRVTLFLPSDTASIPLASDATAVLGASGIQHVTLPAPPRGSLLTAAAEAPVELILALEHQTTDGTWHTVGQDQGLAPILGVPVGDRTTAWRASIWTVDGGAVPIRFASRPVTATPAPVGSVPLVPVQLGGITRQWSAALVNDPGAVMLRLADPHPGLLATSAPDQPAAPPPEGTIVAQSDAVWLLVPGVGSRQLTVVQLRSGLPLTVAVPAAGRAALPIAAPSAPALCAYVAASGLGQPGLEAGNGMDVAPNRAFALCGGARLTVWNAGGEEPLRVRLRRLELAPRPEVAVDQAFTTTLPPHAAVPLRLQAGNKRLDVSVATGGALVAGWHSGNAARDVNTDATTEPITVWAGDAALSRSLTGAWTDALLVNTGDEPAPAALTVSAVAKPPSLASGGMFRRFFGAAGSFVLPLTGGLGHRLVLAGDATASVRRSDGQVRLGRMIPLQGPASAVVTHGAGPLALWIEGTGVSPWPATPLREVTLPSRLALDQEAVTLRLSPGAPVLLRLAGTAPAIVAIGAEAPELFGKGVALARYLPAGNSMLRLLSPQDGPLSGALELSGSPVIEVSEGLGAPVAIPPGGAAVFGFTVTVAGTVGLGVRADPDRVSVRLLDERGETLQSGISMLRQLSPGRYLVEASVPADGQTTLARPAVLGIVPHPNPPPPEVVRGLLLAAGLAPPNGAR
jgi:uncharacterized protein